MVKVYASLLALALATGLAQAFPNSEYQRRSELDSDLYSREFIDSEDVPFAREDLEDFYSREVLDDLDAREPGFGALGGLFRAGAKFAGKRAARAGRGRAVRKAGGRAVRKAGRRVMKHPDETVQNAIDFQNTFGTRDLDAQNEELFGREYDQLEERDIFDDLD